MLMTGVAMSPAILSGILQGCQAAPQDDWIPTFFSPEQGQVIRLVADQILPTTDTPGASDVGVPEFIDLMVNDCMSKKDQDRFMAGLSQFQKDANTALGKPLEQANAEEQLAFLRQVDEQAKAEARATYDKDRLDDPFAATDKEDFYMPFFTDLKSLVIAGYFTSQEVATTQLNYLPIPGEQKGCIPLSEVGSAWALG